MIHIAAIGLFLDFVGVILLGYDLIRVQRHLRRASQERTWALESVLDEYGGLSEWIDNIGRSAYWHHGEWDEGQMIWDRSSFDGDAARESFKEMARAVGSVGQSTIQLATLFVAAQGEDKRAAAISLRYTLTGVTLIAVGFALQFLSQGPMGKDQVLALPW